MLLHLHHMLLHLHHMRLHLHLNLHCILHCTITTIGTSTPRRRHSSSRSASRSPRTCAAARSSSRRAPRRRDCRLCFVSFRAAATAVSVRFLSELTRRNRRGTVSRRGGGVQERHDRRVRSGSLSAGRRSGVVLLFVVASRSPRAADREPTERTNRASSRACAWVRRGILEGRTAPLHVQDRRAARLWAEHAAQGPSSVSAL